MFLGGVVKREEVGCEEKREDASEDEEEEEEEEEKRAEVET